MKKAGWQLVLGCIVLLITILISFSTKDPMSSQLWCSISIISAVFTIHQQLSMSQKENSHE